MEILKITAEIIREKRSRNDFIYLYLQQILLDFIRVENAHQAEGLSEFQRTYIDLKDIPRYFCFPLKDWRGWFSKRGFLMPSFRIFPENCICDVRPSYNWQCERALVELASLLGCGDKVRSAFVRENRPFFPEVTPWEVGKEVSTFLDEYEATIFLKCGVRGNCLFLLWEARRTDEARVMANRILLNIDDTASGSERKRPRPWWSWQRPQP